MGARGWYRAAPILLTCALAVMRSEPFAQTPTPSAEAAVRQTLQRYAAAMESLDVAEVKKVQPTIPADNLARAFRDMRELKVTIDEVRLLAVDGARARVSCRVTQLLIPRVGTRQMTAVTRVILLRKETELWVIDGFER
jgi:flavin-binding protein dodecin